MVGKGRRTLRLLMSALLVAAAPAAVSMPAAARAVPRTAAAAGSPGCDEVLVDEAHVLGAGTTVLDAARKLARAHHATVRVRTYRSVPDGDLDRAVAGEVTRCPSWHDAHDRRRAELVVLAVSLEDRRTGIYYGSGWASALADRQEAVQTGTVNPLLRRGRYTAALTAGLGALGRLLPPRPGPAPQPADAGSSAGEAEGVVGDPGELGVQDPVQAPVDEPAGPGGVAAVAGLGVVGVLGTAAVILILLGGGGRRRSAGPWRSSAGRGVAGGLVASSFTDSSNRFPGGFSGGSDAGPPPSAPSPQSPGPSDGGGSSTSW